MAKSKYGFPAIILLAIHFLPLLKPQDVTFAQKED